MNLQTVLAKCASLHQDIANDVWPNGAILRCQECGHEVEISAEDCARYLKLGWPKHCGRGMLVEVKE